MLTLAVLPSPADMFNAIGVYSSSMFDELMPFAYFLIGCVIGGILINFVISGVIWALGKIRSGRSGSEPTYMEEGGYRKLLR